MKKNLIKISFKRLQLKSLIETEGNPQRMTDAEFKGMVKSIKKNGWLLDAAVCWKRPDGKHQIISGHHRVRAAIEAGLVEADIKVIDGIDEVQARLLVLEANQRKGQFDSKAFDDFVKNLSTDFDIDVEAIFDKIGVIDEGQPEAIEDDYEIPDEIKTDIKLGDLIEIGQHRLLCGDSTDIKQVEKLMNGNKSDMVFTDPPYNVDYGVSKKPRHKIRKINGDKQTLKEWIYFNEKLAFIFKEYCNGDIYLWGASGYDGMKARCIMIEAGLHWSATIIWKKNRLILTPAKYQRIYEPCLYGWFNKSSFQGDRKNIEVWEFDRPSNSDLHPTMKPIKLCANGITLSSKKDNIILDLFIGSGSTMVACHQLNRKCYGMEIDPHYCQVIIDRMLKIDNTLKIKKNGKPYKLSKN